MSDNVTQVNFGGKKPEPGRKKRLMAFGAIVALVLVCVCVAVFWQTWNLDRLRRGLKYWGASKDDYGVFTFEPHSSNSYASLGGGLALGSVGGLSLYGPDGSLLCTVQGAMAAPAVRTGGQVAAAFDAGGSTLLAASEDKGSLLQLEGKNILDADVSPSGEIAYASVEDGYKSVLTVLNNRQAESYKWYSSTQYLPLCAVSSGGSTLAAVALGQNEGIFESTGILWKTNETEIYKTLSLGNQLIYDLAFLSERQLCAVGESQLLFFDVEGQETGAYDYEKQYLESYDLGGDGFALLGLNAYQAGNHCSVVSVGTDGTELARTYVGKEILDLSASGNYAAVLTADALTIYTKDLEVYQEKENDTGASRVLMHSDGSAILIATGEAQLYLP